MNLLIFQLEFWCVHADHLSLEPQARWVLCVGHCLTRLTTATKAITAVFLIYSIFLTNIDCEIMHISTIYCIVQYINLLCTSIQYNVHILILIFYKVMATIIIFQHINWIFLYTNKSTTYILMKLVKYRSYFNKVWIELKIF